MCILGILLAIYGTLGIAGGIVSLPYGDPWYIAGSMVFPVIFFLSGIYIIGNGIRKLKGKPGINIDQRTTG